jgi:ABC-type enterobactin transport system permease subunit
MHSIDTSESMASILAVPEGAVALAREALGSPPPIAYSAGATKAGVVVYFFTTQAALDAAFASDDLYGGASEVVEVALDGTTTVL